MADSNLSARVHVGSGATTAVQLTIFPGVVLHGREYTSRVAAHPYLVVRLRNARRNKKKKTCVHYHQYDDFSRLSRSAGIRPVSAITHAASAPLERFMTAPRSKDGLLCHRVADRYRLVICCARGQVRLNEANEIITPVGDRVYKTLLSYVSRSWCRNDGDFIAPIGKLGIWYQSQK